MWEKIKNLLNVRKLPHFERPNYLGASMRCKMKEGRKAGSLCLPPLDALDFVGVLHDYDTKNKKDIWVDFKYTFRMLAINPSDRKNYDFTVKTKFFGREFYLDPRIFQYLSAIVMGTLGLFTAPLRGVKNVWGDF